MKAGDDIKDFVCIMFRKYIGIDCAESSKKLFNQLRV